MPGSASPPSSPHGGRREMRKDRWTHLSHVHMQCVVDAAPELKAHSLTIGEGIKLGTTEYDTACIVMDPSTPAGEYILAAVQYAGDMLAEIERLQSDLLAEQQQRILLQQRLNAMEHFRQSFNAAIEQVGAIASPWDNNKENDD